jgi:uncharacterized OsmC-like protein
MTTIQVTHLTTTRYGVTLGQHCLIIDQPEAAGGNDLGPTPVQLFVASLAACAAHYAGSYLARHGLTAEGLTVQGDYLMASDGTPRVTSITMTVTPPADLPADRRAGLLALASNCTLHNTLRQPPTIAIDLTQESTPDEPAPSSGLKGCCDAASASAYLVQNAHQAVRDGQQRDGA